MRQFLAVVALFFAITAVPASATTYDSFVFDASASSITVTPSGSICLGCSLTAAFSSGVDGATWTPSSPTDSWTISNFIDWEAAGGFGGATYDVAATLAFSAPDAASTSGGGTAGYASFFGVISAGYLTWHSFAPVSFAQGSMLDVALEGGVALFSGTSISTGVTFTGNTIVPSPVPLPAAGWLLLAGIGGLAALRRRTRT